MWAASLTSSKMVFRAIWAGGRRTFGTKRFCTRCLSSFCAGRWLSRFPGFSRLTPASAGHEATKESHQAHGFTSRWSSCRSCSAGVAGSRASVRLAGSLRRPVPLRLTRYHGMACTCGHDQPSRLLQRFLEGGPIDHLVLAELGEVPEIRGANVDHPFATGYGG
jgi:hypothetical protein